MTLKRLGTLIQSYPAPVITEDDSPDVLCPTCGDKGVINIPARWEGAEFIPNQLRRCPNPTCPIILAQEQERYGKLVDRAQIPPEYAGLTFASWEALIAGHPDVMRGKWNAYGAAKAFVEANKQQFFFSLARALQLADRSAQAAKAAAPDRLKALYPDPFGNYANVEVGNKNSLVFTGSNGLGKTSLASAIAQVLLAERVPVLYARTQDFLSAVRERFERGKRKEDYEFEWGDSEMAIVATFQQIPVLILDEFGLGQYTDWNRTPVEQVVRYRYANHKATIFTTNLGYEELADDAHWMKAIGHAVHGMAHWVQLAGMELRRRDGVLEAR